MISMRRQLQHCVAAAWRSSSLRATGGSQRVKAAAFGCAAFFLVGLAYMPLAHAQDVQGKKPGVIKRGGDQAKTPQNKQADQKSNAQNQKKKSNNKLGGKVITPQSVNPNEQYNLPPNFNPNYRPKRTPRNTKVTLDFRQAQLEEVVKFFAAAMNKNFIISDSLQANKTITIISPQEVSLAEAYRAFIAALEMNGLTIVPFGKFSKIVEAKKAISEPMGTYTNGERLPNVPRMVTAIVPLENTAPDEMQDVIGKFASQYATIIPYGNSLIITENASNLSRLRRLIHQLDQNESTEQVYVYDVQYAEATDIKDKLEQIFQAEQNQTTTRRRRRRTKAPATKQNDGELNVQISQILADERTNKLIIVANPHDFDKIKQMIQILDVPTAVGGQVHVKFLEYADAEEIASALSSLASGQNQHQRTARRGRQPHGNEVANQVAALLQGDVQITAYKPNNALIVTASPKDYVALEQVIDMLDRPRKQVYVEAVIMEIAMDNDTKFGVGVSAVTGQDYDAVIPNSAKSSGLIDSTEGGILGQSNFGGLSSLLGGGVAGSIGLIGPIATIPGTQILAAGVRADLAGHPDRSLGQPAVGAGGHDHGQRGGRDRGRRPRPLRQRPGQRDLRRAG